MGSSTEYQRWYNMIQRCENPCRKEYYRYGGRGIKVCERWHDRALFLADLEREIGPANGRTLDRIDTDGDYEPGNVKWATWKEQAATRHPARPPAACGTRSGYHRHRKNHEEACRPCKDASAAYIRSR